MYITKTLFTTFITLSSSWLVSSAPSRLLDRSNVDAFTTFSNVTVFSPPSSYKIPRTLYARSLLLSAIHEHEKIVLSTWENYGPEPPYFPIMSSADGGMTWSEIGRVEDQVNGWGMRYQPFLFELPQDVGNFKAGTILCAGSSIPEDLSVTQIELYASVDKGRTWNFVSHVARGGVALPNNGETPVWEPFLMMWEGQVVVYYSDQRDPLHGQKIVHQVTGDLVNWGPVVTDFADPVYKSRPGMPTIAKLHRGRYLMTYEYYGASEADFAVYYKISTDPTRFEEVEGQVLRASDGTVPVGSPYVIFTPHGGEHGTIVVSSGNHGEVFINRESGDPDAWVKVGTPEAVSYTRSLLLMPLKDNVMIMGGGVLMGEDNKVTVSVVDITKV